MLCWIWLNLRIIFKCVKTCINLLLTRITTTEISRIKVNNQKWSPFRSAGVPSEHGSALGSSVAFSWYKRTEIKDELLGCALFSLLWTGCNPSVLEEWKVCGVQKVGRPSLLSPSYRAESVTQQGATICYQRTLQSFSSARLRRIVVHTWQKQEKWLCSSMSKQEKKKKIGKTVEQINCLLEWAAFCYFWVCIRIFRGMFFFIHTRFEYGCWQTIKTGLFPPQWAPSLLPKVNLSSALISIVP